MILATPALILEASIVSTAAYRTELAAFPAANLVDLRASRVWRSEDLAPAKAMIDLGSAQTWDLVALLGNNASSAATWRVRAGDSEADAAAGVVYDSTTPAALWPQAGLTTWSRTHAFHLPASAKTSRYVYVEVSDAANDDGFFEANVLLVARLYTPNRALLIRDEPSWGWTDGSERARSRGGALFAADDARFRFAETVLRFMDAAEGFGSALEIARRFGGPRPVFVHFDPTNADRGQDWCLWADFLPGNPVHVADQAYFAQRYRFEEVLAL